MSGFWLILPPASRLKALSHSPMLPAFGKLIPSYCSANGDPLPPLGMRLTQTAGSPHMEVKSSNHPQLPKSTPVSPSSSPPQLPLLAFPLPSVGCRLVALCAHGPHIPFTKFFVSSIFLFFKPQPKQASQCLTPTQHLVCPVLTGTCIVIP